MVFLTNSNLADTQEYNAPRLAHYGGALYSKEKPQNIGEFRLMQTVIPLEGGQYYLQLLKCLTLKVDADFNCFVQDWGITVQYSDVAQVPREVARRFLFLLSAAENEQLTENDQADLVRISEYIDFRQYSINRSPPRYQEGVLQSNSEKIIVEWQDGKRETLTGKSAHALDILNVGEKFSAYIKLGKNDKVIAIERVSLLSSSPEFSKEDWSAWPKKN